MNIRYLVALGLLWMGGLVYAQEVSPQSVCKSGPAIEDTGLAAQRISKLLGKPVSIARRHAVGFECEAEAAGFHITPQRYMGTTSHTLSSDVVHGGNKSHKAWMHGSNDLVFAKNTNHRGYPTFQFQKTKEGAFKDLVFTEIWVWLDVALEKSENKDWFSFATFTSYADDQWARTVVVNVDANHIVHLMHVPDQAKKIYDIYQTTTVRFPMRQWVKISTLLDYTADNEYKSPHVKVWQDEVLVSAARFNARLANVTDVDPRLWPPCAQTWNRTSIEQLENLCGARYMGGLAQAHFGMYAPPLLTSGTVYNDDLVFYELKR